ncbi:hypothetical protein DY000_02009407 [Brassica cretica]|uniref:Uncharacterized protein n=1 Tax=Brassica cretica TaxID=69181 RepID=A0ABQ7CEC1_BRACR|nr:hypothetical protein DY000_02009407 [Brassica cretica]
MDAGDLHGSICDMEFIYNVECGQRFPSQVPLFLLRVVDLCLFASGPDGAYRRPEGSASRLGFLALLLLHLSVSPSICAASWAAVWRRGLLHCRGASSPVVSLFLWDFGEEGERVVDRVVPPVRRQFAALVLGGIRIGMTILGSRWFVELEVSPSWFGVCWWILLPRQWVVCWSTHVVGARAQWPTRISFGFALSVSGRDGVAPPVRRQFAALVLGGIRLGMAILSSRWFVELEVSPSWLGVCWWILLPRQWVVGWSTHLVGARAQWPTRVRSSVRFKEWSSMPLQWLLAMPPH